MISIILYLCILWTYAGTNKTVDITAVAKPHAKGNESIVLSKGKKINLIRFVLLLG